MFLAGECWHMYAHISFTATVDLQTELIPSYVLSVSSPTCTLSPPSLTPLQKRAPHNSNTVDLEKLSSFVASKVYVKSAACVLSNTKS